MFVTQAVLETFLTALDAAWAKPGRVYLIGETTQVFEGWRTWTDEAELAAEVDDTDAFAETAQAVAGEAGIAVWVEHPADVIPLPEGFSERHRSVVLDNIQHMDLQHFDPYSVAFRFIARGDEPDYHLVLAYLDNGWVTWAEMDRLLAELLSQFSLETIQQDPAEFRRKYKGLRQMAHSVRPGVIHRHTPA